MSVLVSVHTNRLVIRFPYNETLKVSLKTTGIVTWEPGIKSWVTSSMNVALYDWLDKNDAEVSPEALRWIEEWIEAEQYRKALGDIKYELAHCTGKDPIEYVAKQLKFEPYPYQWVPCYYAEISDGRLMNTDLPGLGKTVQSVMVTLLPRFERFPVMVICPKSLTHTWKNELKDRFDIDAHIIDGPFTRLKPGVRFYILKDNMLKWLDKDLGYFWIIDECHRFKNGRTQRTKRMRSLTKKSDHVIELTGTPIMNCPAELYSPLVILDPKMPYNKMGFDKEYCGAYWSDYGYVNTGATHLDKLHKWLFRNYLMRREKETVLPQLPPKTRQIIDLDRVSVEAESVLELYSKSASVKAENEDFIEYIDEVMQTEKVLVFAHHRHMLDKIESRCKALGLKYIRIDGTTEEAERAELVRRFQTDETIQVAILSILVAGVGITLTAASTAIFAELQWAPGMLDQAENRLHRIGTKTHVTILYPLLTEFDHELYEMLLDKMLILAKAIDGKYLDQHQKKGNVLKDLSAKFGLPINKRKNNIA
jgi:SWI/SNF-related matrix-associated actin-dependent regulator of chromatin subfamily A-like protein 1